MASYRQPFLSRSATVVEPHILDSTFLDDIEEDVEKLKNTYKSVKAVLSDAENRQLTEEAVRVWVEKLKVVSCEIEDALGVWNTLQLKKQISGAANTTGSNPYPLSDCSWLKQLAQKGEFPSRISELNKRLDDINKEKDAYRFTSEPVATASATFTEPHILDSTFLDDIEEDVEKLKNTYELAKAELSDAENRQLTEEAVRVRVENLKVVSCKIEDALDVWNTVLLKKQISGAANTTGSNPYPLSDCSWLKQLDNKGDFPSRIRKLNELLDPYNLKSKPVATASVPPQRRQSASFINASTVCGRDPEIQRLVGDLCKSSGQPRGGLEVISVVGMGGVGKTTLAQRVYNDATVKSHFQKRVWVCVSDPFVELQVCKAIAKSLGADPTKFTDYLQDILECINKSIAGERFMFVLDDVWTEDYSHWESLLSILHSGAEGSKILVTTRNEKCATAIGSSSVHPLGQLSPEESWELFSQIAFSNKSEEDVENLKEVGQKIAQKCKGLPLALKAIASHLQFKSTTRREWERVLESEIWELETAEKRIFKPLLLSYYDLPSPIKKCFSFCAVFPKDYQFDVEELIRMWMSQGYLNTSRRNEEDMERVGEEYFQHLLTRSFFQDLEFQEHTKSSSCKMHDIVHDFAQFLSKDESLIIDIATENNKKPAAGLSLRHLTVLNAGYSVEDVMSSAFSRSSSKQQRLHLHTLRISRSSMMNSLQDLSQHLCFVKALDLSEIGTVEVPEEIGQLVHLRYLNLSRNKKLERLPGTIYELCNLQTLLLNGCFELRELAEEGIEKLINLRYLDLSRNKKLERLPGTIYELCNLQTLLLNWCKELRELPEEGIEKLINLRYLDLSWNSKLERLPGTIYELCNLQTLLLNGCEELRELPEEGIEKLINLRYLDLSSNRKLERLPGTIYELCNLQTLLLDGCDELRELPEEGIEKLINLRHLEINDDMVLPKGIGSLSSLRTLNCFNVCRDDGGEVGATIGDLGNLNNLQGSLKLGGLNNVKDGREASKAELRNKKGLTVLFLDFEEGEPGNKEEEVIEALEPPSHSLEELDIWGYSGKVLPRWISSSLSKLRELRLYDLMECEELPPSIGQLPCLETLEINGSSCKRIGEEFFGIKRTITGAGGGGSDDGTKMTTSSSVAAVAFPKLKTLKFARMREWREWEEDMLLIRNPNDDIIHFKLFPCLHELYFGDCPKLKSLPQFIFSKSPIRSLWIVDCPNLEERCRPETGGDWSKISHIPNIRVEKRQGHNNTVFEIVDGQLRH